MHQCSNDNSNKKQKHYLCKDERNSFLEVLFAHIFESHSYTERESQKERDLLPNGSFPKRSTHRLVQGQDLARSLTLHLCLSHE